MNVKVRDVMTPSPLGVDYNQPIAEAAQAMRDLGLGVMFVIRDGALHGMVTDRDLVVRGVAGSLGPDAPVGPLSSTDVVVVEAGADTDEAVTLMRTYAVRRLPVIEDGRLTGVVSLGDLAVVVDEESALADVSRAIPNL